MDTTTAARGGERTGSAPRLAARAAVVAVVVVTAAFALVGVGAAQGAASATISVSDTAHAGTSTGATAQSPDLPAGATNPSFAWHVSAGTVTADPQDSSKAIVTLPTTPGTYTVSVDLSYDDPVSGRVDVANAGSTTIRATNAAPSVSLASLPDSAIYPQTLTLNADGSAATDPDGDALTYSWKDSKGATFADPLVQSPLWSASPKGTHLITLRVEDPSGAFASDTTAIVVPDQPPAPSFISAADPTDPRTFTFTSTTTDPDTPTISLSLGWDFDNNGSFTDASGPVVTHTFPGPGTYIVRLRASDGTTSKTELGSVTVGDNPPTVTLSIAPNPVAPNQPVTITAAASDPDPDGANLTYTWDVNGTAYAGPTIPQQIFTTPGVYKVKVTVRDPQNATASDSDSIIVSEAATASSAVAPPASTSLPPVVNGPPPTPPTGKTAPKLIDPFPIVRIRGRIFPRYTKFDVFSIRAPKGATVRVRCKGPSCPRKWSIAAVKRRTHWVRFRPLERNMPAGTVLEIFVEKQGLIGKYTRFIVRAGQAPSRRDRCVKGSRSRVVRCPAG